MLKYDSLPFPWKNKVSQLLLVKEESLYLTLLLSTLYLVCFVYYFTKLFLTHRAAIRKTGADLPAKPSRAPRNKEFPTQGRLNMKIKGSEVKANENRNNGKADIFTGTLNLININKGKDAEAIGMRDNKINRYDRLLY